MRPRQTQLVSILTGTSYKLPRGTAAGQQTNFWDKIWRSKTVNKAFTAYLSTFGLEITPDDDPDEHYSGFRLVQPIPLSPGEPPMDIPAQLVKQLEDAGFEVDMNYYLDEPFQMERRAIPNDPFYATEQRSYMEQMFAPDIWNTIHDADDANGPLICIIDTGLDCNHAELHPNCYEVTYQRQVGSLYLPTRKKMLRKKPLDELLLKGPPQVFKNSLDATASFNTAKPGYLSMDGGGHGTFVAGVIAASGNNRRGVSGMVWNAKVVGCSHSYRHGASTEVSKTVKCIKFCKDVGAKITVNSYGQRVEQVGYSRVLFEAFKGYSTALHVSAAGNQQKHFQSVDPKAPGAYFPKILTSDTRTWRAGLGILQPAAYSQSLTNVISIGSLNAEFTNKAIHSNYGDGYVDIFAPGTNIASTVSMYVC